MMNISIILNSIFLSLTFISCLISGLVLLLIFIRIRPSISNVSILLTCNTYLTIIFFGCTLLDIGVHSLYGQMNPSISFAGRWCTVRAYFAHVCFCAFYHSFVLQAIFRLFRVVFYKNKILQTFGVLIIAILMQWLFSFLFILPHIFLNDFQYQPRDYNCWISFKSIRAMLLATLNIYGGPLCIIAITYTYIIRYVRRTNNIQQKRQKANKRDMIILRRIVSLLLVLVMIGVPTLSVLMFYILTNYLTPFAYDIQALNISLNLVITTVTLVFITPKIRQTFRQSGLVLIKRRSIKRTMTISSTIQQLTDSKC